MRVVPSIVAALLFVGCSLVSGQGSSGSSGQSGCNCPGVGWCDLNCTTPAGCCGGGTEEPSCMVPGNQCCLWFSAATQCASAETCCGEAGYGASSTAFCCGAGSSCCATNLDGTSQCCGPKQQCCGGYNTFCCDAEAEVCGPENSMLCLPKMPITRNPHLKPGQLEWAANLTLSGTRNVIRPVVVNASFVLASGAATTALVRVSDGAVTNILPPAVATPTVAAGRVIVATATQLIAYDLKAANQSWATNFNSAFVGLVSHDHYLLAVSGTPSALNVYDARNGTLLYAIFYGAAPTTPVVSPYGTVAFGSFGSMLIFHLDTGKVLRNAGTTCYNQAPPLLAGSIFVSCNLAAYSARSGKQMWSTSNPPRIFNFAATTKAVVADSGGHLCFLERSSGRLINNISVEGPVSNSQALTAVGNVVILATGNLTAYNGTTAQQVWSYSGSTYSFWQSAGAYHSGYVYAPATFNDFPAAMVAVDPATGAIAASWGAGGTVSSPVFVDGRVLFMAGDGFLYCAVAL